MPGDACALNYIGRIDPDPGTSARRKMRDFTRGSEVADAGRRTKRGVTRRARGRPEGDSLVSSWLGRDLTVGRAPGGQK